MLGVSADGQPVSRLSLVTMHLSYQITDMMMQHMDRLQVKVVLVWSDPPIWRRLEIPADTILVELHDLIQIAMGWENDHLFAFYLRPPGSRSKRYHSWGELDLESEAPLGTVLAKRSDELIYEYDFGDSWVYRIKLEKRLPPLESAAVPRCTAGQGSCPPEDCGGISGYERMLKAIADKTHPRHDEMLAWFGDDFDSKRFDCARINKRLKSYWAADA